MSSLETSDSQLENSCSTWRGFPAPKGSECRVLVGTLKGLSSLNLMNLHQSGEALFQENPHPEGMYHIEKKVHIKVEERSRGRSFRKENVFWASHQNSRRGYSRAMKWGGKTLISYVTSNRKIKRKCYTVLQEKESKEGNDSPTSMKAGRNTWPQKNWEL